MLKILPGQKKVLYLRLLRGKEKTASGRTTYGWKEKIWTLSAIHFLVFYSPHGLNKRQRSIFINST